MNPEFIGRYRDAEARGDNPLYSSFNGLGYVVFKRTYARPIAGEDRTEHWYETIERVIDGAAEIGAGLTPAEEELLFDHIWNLRCSVSGRALWQLGTENIRRFGGDSLVNCWHVTIRTPEDFSFLFNELMLGGGVGFTIPEEVNLPEVHSATIEHFPEAKDADFIVPDKREGWAELLARILNAYFEGTSFSYSTLLVRPEGAPISTFGGTASGPGILVDGVAEICKILDARTGQTLQPIDVLDIANLIGSIVVSGNVRRSAQIALHGPDPEFLNAKRWDLGNIPYWRAMSNNTVVADSIDELPQEFWNGYLGKGEPYGLFSKKTARKWGRTGEVKWDGSITGVNPCGEIPLGDHESCNLSEIFLPNIRTWQELQEISQLLYKIQKAIAGLPYLDSKTEEIVHRNMRLGQSVTGLAQATPNQLGWLDDAYRTLERFDENWSKRYGWPASVRLTTVKPSGTSSLLAGVTPGGHPGFSQYHIRRVRFSSSDPLVNWCRERGYRTEFQRDFDGEENRRTVIVEFPCEFPETTQFADDTTAIQQLDFVAWLQRTWADNAVSVTIYYSPEELPEIQDWLRANEGDWKSVSFLLRSEHGFDQAPLEKLTAEEYAVRIAEVRSHRHDATGISSLALDDADCVAGACPIR